MEDNVIDIEERSFLYIMRDEINLSMIDFSEYIKNNYSLIDCDIIKKNYIYITTELDKNTIMSYIIKYIIEKIINTYDNIDKFNINEIVLRNIDIFVDVIENDNNVYIIEISK